jgi:electron transfer flavoprotein alpha subunit
MSNIFKSGSIVVVAECFQGEIRPVTHELVRFAEALQKIKPAEIQILVLGEKVEDLAKHLAVTSGKNVLGLSAPELAQYNAEATKSVLHDVLGERPPAYICVAHSSRGSDFAPGLAMRLKAACITGVSSISFQEDEICFSRDIFGGKINADMLSSAKTTVLTVQPGSYGATPKKDQTSGKVFFKSIAVTSQSSTTLSTTAYQTSDLDLSTAKVIVSAGRGIGEEENLQLIRDLAFMIPQSVVCGSRPVIDLGWMSYDRQVGVTGATVTPDLYLACGISGAAQHASGMKGSGFIVSINTDPLAAIFNFSDICIVENLITFIPLLLEKMAEQTTGKVSPG